MLKISLGLENLILGLEHVVFWDGQYNVLCGTCNLYTEQFLFSAGKCSFGLGNVSVCIENVILGCNILVLGWKYKVLV